MIDQNVIDRILNSVDIVNEIGSDITLRKKGVNYEGCCPFHNEKTPSFKVSPAKGIFKCFGCGTGGSVIQYIQLRDNMTFPEAVEYLAKKHNIEYEKYNPSPEERELGFKREAIFNVNKVALDYFLSGYSKSPGAQKYAKARWKPETIQEQQIGYAPESWDGLMNYAKKLGYKEQVLLDAGLISEKNGKRFDFFVGRLIFPIRNRTGNIIAFSGRIIKEDPEKKSPKYINTRETIVFQKKDNLFGMFEARRQAARDNKINVVEGAPDVVRLHECGITNTVAPLGTALTKEQIGQIRSVARSVTVIGDTDSAGQKAVLKNGEALFRAGLNVSVMAIPDGKDPDEYFKDKPQGGYSHCLTHFTSDFITHLARNEFENISAASDQMLAIEKVCDILVDFPDEATVDVYVEQLGKLYKPRSAWTSKIAEKRNAKQMDARKKNNQFNEEMLQKFGFSIENNSYWAFGKTGNVKWSNFVMQPLAHIRSITNAKRLFIIKNEFGDEQTIELKQEDLVSIMKFRIKVESMGNYIWEAGESELHKLKRYLYDKTETCEEITQLGWQKRHRFFAWGNGGYCDGKMEKVDDIGILRLESGSFYLPAFSKIFKNEQQLFQFERRFTHSQANGISLEEYSKKLITVFGDNAKVGLCFLIATLFKDVITAQTKSFPILNLFGPKGTGKSELGHSLTSFFISDNTPPNISNTTIAALAEAVAQVSNAIVHIDEYKNTLEIDKVEFLKGLWDGAGRTRMNMDRDKKRETTVVDAGVVLSGQEMPTADIALFSRLIFLTFYRTEYSDQEKKDFEDLKRIEKRGLSHLTNEILSHRKKFEVDFTSSWEYVQRDLSANLTDYTIEDRTQKNWLTVLAAFRCMENELRLPFTYKEVLEIATNGIIEQNLKTKQNNELSGFWETIENLVRSSQMWIDIDYKIKYLPKPVNMVHSMEPVYLVPDKPYLLIGFNRMASLYLKEGRSSGNKAIPKDSLKYYLERSREYRGTIKSVKFKTLTSAGGYVQAIHDPLSNQTSYKTTVTTAMVFDYQAIQDMYGIDINTIITPYSDEEYDKQEEPQGIEPEATQANIVF